MKIVKHLKLVDYYSILQIKQTSREVHVIYMEKYKKSYKNNKFKIPALKWNEKLELLNGSYSVWDI